MKKTIYIIRHGDKKKTLGDPPLSELGEKQAALTANFMSIYPVDKIVASPILRTRQTARYIANRLDMDFSVDDLLRERVNWGDDPMQSFDDFLSMWRKASVERKWKPPVGDSSFDAGNRLTKLITDPKYSDVKSMALVTHGGILTDFLRNTFSSDYLNNFISDFENKLEESVKECSITILENNSDNDSFDLIKLADVEHLKKIQFP